MNWILNISAFKTSNITQHLLHLHTQTVLHRFLSPTLYSDKTNFVNMSISNKNKHTNLLCRFYWQKPGNMFVRYGKSSQFRHWKSKWKAINAFLFLGGELTASWELAWNLIVWWKVEVTQFLILTVRYNSHGCSKVCSHLMLNQTWLQHGMLTLDATTDMAAARCAHTWCYTRHGCSTVCSHLMLHQTWLQHGLLTLDATPDMAAARYALTWCYNSHGCSMVWSHLMLQQPWLQHGMLTLDATPDMAAARCAQVWDV